MKNATLIFVVTLATLFASSCGTGSKGSGLPNNNPPTMNLAGTWTVQVIWPGYPTGGPDETVSVTLVPSPCSMQVPVGDGEVPDAGTYTLQGPVCYIADPTNAMGAAKILTGPDQGSDAVMLIGVPQQVQNGTALEIRYAEFGTDESRLFAGTGTVQGAGAQASTWSGSWSTSQHDGLPVNNGNFSAAQ